MSASERSCHIRISTVFFPIEVINVSEVLLLDQASHRHIPILIRAGGLSFAKRLRIISDPPQGSENLLTQVVQFWAKSPDLVATVKPLYETKLKDATILIPMLYLRCIEQRFSVDTPDIDEPLSLKPLSVLPPFGFDIDYEDDFETLRAIQRRFSHYKGYEKLD